MSGDLFGRAEKAASAGGAPLAERLRPRSLDEVVGQKVTAEGSMLRLALESDRVPSLILWGPPGSGKTTLARLLASVTGHQFEAFSAVLSGVKEVRDLVGEARRRRQHDGLGTILFVDEIHRFNKAQQDAFLPHVEDGTIVLVGATTENPSFHVNGALLSRCMVLPLDPLSVAALKQIATRALTDVKNGLGALGVTLDDEALEALARTSHGDARSLLNRLETVVLAARTEKGVKGALGIGDLDRLLPVKVVAHDKDGDQHFDLVSAFHKSIRGGDPQATLYWLARMLAGGEEPLYLLRRMVRIAIEDIGLADPEALRLAVAAVEAWRFLGSPEGDLVLAETAVYLATAPKSNSVYAAFGAVSDEVGKGAVHPVPAHLRNAPTRLMKQLGHGKGYLYPHDFDEGVADQSYLPAELEGRVWYDPSPFGHEKEIQKRIAWWERVLGERRGEASARKEESR